MSRQFSDVLKVQEAFIIQRLREQLPQGTTLVEDDHAIIFRMPGLKPIIFNASRVTVIQLQDTVHQLQEWSKVAEFGRE